MTQKPRRSGYASADETVHKRLSQRRWRATRQKLLGPRGVENRAWQENQYLQIIRPSAILLVQGGRQKLQTKK